MTDVKSGDRPEQTSDLELTRLCAEAMGLRVFVDAYGDMCIEQLDILSADNVAYRPLHDDAQAMALVKKFSLRLERGGKSGIIGVSHVARRWCVRGDTVDPFEHEAWDEEDLNRAICECVAKMQQNRLRPKQAPDSKELTA